MVFRLYYYIIPLFLAGGMFAGNEILLRGGALLRARRSRSGRRRSSAGASPISPSSPSTGAVALCGAMLLGARRAGTGVRISPGSTPISPTSRARPAQFVPSLIGAALMVLAIGLSQRVTLAWGATIVLLLLAAASPSPRGERLGPGGAGAGRPAGGAVPARLSTATRAC